MRFTALIVLRQTRVGPVPAKGEPWLSLGACSQKKPLCELSGGSAPPGMSLPVGDGVLVPRSSQSSGNSWGSRARLVGLPAAGSCLKAPPALLQHLVTVRI